MALSAARYSGWRSMNSGVSGEHWRLTFYRCPKCWYGFDVLEQGQGEAVDFFLVLHEEERVVIWVSRVRDGTHSGCKSI